MSTKATLPLFYVLLALVPIWWVSATLVWMRLITRHTETYDAMGRPHFFSLIGNFAVVRFILGRRHRLLGDQVLAIRSDLAMGVFLAFIADFATLLLLTRHR
jgi:hypothetical protein